MNITAMSRDPHPPRKIKWRIQSSTTGIFLHPTPGIAIIPHLETSFSKCFNNDLALC